MIFPCKVYDKFGKLKKTHSIKELVNRHWAEDKNPEFKRFSEAAHQAIKYAETRTDTRSDYIPTTDRDNSNKHRGKNTSGSNDYINYKSMLKNGS